MEEKLRKGVKRIRSLVEKRGKKIGKRGLEEEEKRMRRSRRM